MELTLNDGDVVDFTAKKDIKRTLPSNEQLTKVATIEELFKEATTESPTPVEVATIALQVEKHMENSDAFIPKVDTHIYELANNKIIDLGPVKDAATGTIPVPVTTGYIQVFKEGEVNLPDEAYSADEVIVTTSTTPIGNSVFGFKPPATKTPPSASKPTPQSSPTFSEGKLKRVHEFIDEQIRHATLLMETSSYSRAMSKFEVEIWEKLKRLIDE